MEFGSSSLLAGPSLADSEDIYTDDVEDGIASMASEMAAAWCLEYEELKASDSSLNTKRAIFLKTLITLCNKVMHSKQGAKRGGAQHGPMGKSLRRVFQRCTFSFSFVYFLNNFNKKTKQD